MSGNVRCAAVVSWLTSCPVADTRRGETILGFYLRAGMWIDGIQILTSLGRRSEIFGNSLGGSG